jgi:hypothetical protein
LVIVNVAVAARVVVPEPLIVPPDHPKAPETARFPVPSIVPALNVRPVTEWFDESVTVPPEIVAESAAPGNVPPQLDQRAMSVQSPVVEFQTQAAAQRS